MSKEYSGRTFLQPSPSLNSISWETRVKQTPEYEVPIHFYGKFTIAWGSTVVGIHSYGEYGHKAASKFREKCETAIVCIDRYIRAVHSNSYSTYHTHLNDEDTPFSGAIYWKRDKSPSGNLISIFEISSCKFKIRIHSHEVGGEAKLCKILKRIINQVDQLLDATFLIEKELNELAKQKSLFGESNECI
jgi:hypothetical protein